MIINVLFFDVDSTAADDHGEFSLIIQSLRGAVVNDSAPMGEQRRVGFREQDGMIHVDGIARQSFRAQAFLSVFMVVHPLAVHVLGRIGDGREILHLRLGQKTPATLFLLLELRGFGEHFFHKGVKPLPLDD